MIFSCVKQCEGCGHVWGGAVAIGDNVCAQYARPYAKWHKLGGCEGATNVERKTTEAAKVRVGQQKQKKAKQ